MLLPNLTHLHLNLRSWGYASSVITNKSLFYLGKSIENRGKLKSLKLNLYCWGYNNDKITDEGLFELVKNIGTLKQL